MLTAIPVMRGIWWLQELLSYGTCPWRNDSSVEVISLFSSEVLSVVTIICFNTFICCIFYMISVGWNVTIFRIERGNLTNVIIVGGTLYLA